MVASECSLRASPVPEVVHDAYEGEDVDALLTVAHSKAKEWRELGSHQKCDLLRQCLRLLQIHHEEYRTKAFARRNYKLDASDVAYQVEQLAVALVSTVQAYRWLATLLYAHTRLADDASWTSCDASVPPPVQHVAVDYTGAKVLDAIHLDLVIDPTTLVDVPKSQCGISVVIGAASYDAPMDLLHALFIENTVTIYQAHPQNQAILSIYKKIFQPLLDCQFLFIETRPKTMLTQMLYDPRVTHWIMTGGKMTAYKFIYGTPTSPFSLDPGSSITEDVITSKVAWQPYHSKRFVFELGTVSPWIICPEEWTDEEMDVQVKHLAGALIYNGGHICVHPQVVVTSRGWAQRHAFFAKLRHRVQQTKFPEEFYPGSQDRFETLKQRLQEEGNYRAEDEWAQGKFLFVQECSVSSVLLNEESFCRISAEVCLDPSESLRGFLDAAIQLCNTRVEGTLGATIICKDPSFVKPVLSSLHYGVIGLNIWVLAGALCPQGIWGAYPGCSNLASLGSGLNAFGNCLRLRHPKQAILSTEINAPILDLMMYPKDPQELARYAELVRSLTPCTLSSDKSPYTTT